MEVSRRNLFKGMTVSALMMSARLLILLEAGNWIVAFTMEGEISL